MDVISHAQMVLHWYEHVLPEEMPPEWMWLFPEDLNEHFDKLRARRRAGTQSDNDEPIQGPVIENELARRRGRHAV